MKYAAVFDIDGTLAGISPEREKILARHGIDNHNRLDMADDAVVRDFMDPELLRNAPVLQNEATFIAKANFLIDGVQRVFLTGRLECLRLVTTEWLMENINTNMRRGIMRQESQRRWSPARYKKFGLMLLKMELGVDKIFFFDDDKDVCDIARTLDFVTVIHVGAYNGN